jgi:hypothetical protein
MPEDLAGFFGGGHDRPYRDESAGEEGEAPDKEERTHNHLPRVNVEWGEVEGGQVQLGAEERVSDDDRYGEGQHLDDADDEEGDHFPDN